LAHLPFNSSSGTRDTNFMERTSQFIHGMGLRSSDRELIYAQNAARVMKLNI
jgi:hypothetical protein